MADIIDFFPFARGAAEIDHKRKRFGIYRFVMTLLMYERANDDESKWMHLHPLHRSIINKRLDERPPLNEEKLGIVVPFPQRKALLTHASEPAEGRSDHGP